MVQDAAEAVGLAAGPGRTAVAAAGGSGHPDAPHRPAVGLLRAERLHGHLRAIPRPAVKWAAVLCAAVLVAGCGGGEDEPPAPAGGPLGPGARLQTATCREWRAAPAHQRANTVDRLEEV